MSDTHDTWLDSLTAPRIAAAVAILWCLSPILLNFLVGPLERAGLAGDSFGAVNALFSGLAFGGVIYAILLQRSELKLQREELMLTRKELKRSASAQENTEAVLERQAQLMRVTAEINGLAAIVEAYSMQLQVLHSEGYPGARPRAHLIPSLETDRDKFVDRLKRQLEAVSKDSESPNGALV